MNAIQKQFPILKKRIQGKLLVYFDNAATTQKPLAVLKAIIDFYESKNANVHRSMNPLGEAATESYESARTTVAQFINAPHREEVIFTRGTTESINLFARSWGVAHLRPGDIVVIPITEHHSNIVPWLTLKQEIGIEIAFLPLDATGRISVSEAKKILGLPGVRLLTMALASNTLGTIHPVQELLAHARSRGICTFVDAAQAAAHMPIDVQSLGCDFLAFSGHKMFGPTGIGVLWGKKSILEKMPPWQTGGDMIHEVFLDHYTLNELPFRFEAGTPHISGAVGLAAAIQFIQKIGWSRIIKIETGLTQYLLGKLSELPFVSIFGPRDSHNHLPLIPFAVENVHPHDLADLLGAMGICIRAGHHCTQPLHENIKAIATARVSLSIYNTTDEIDLFISALKKIHARFN